MKNSICIVANGYPTKDDPVYAFIQPVAREMADAGVSCTVIAPQSVAKRAVAKKAKRPHRWIDRTDKGNEVVIYQPEYMSVSNLSVLGYSISALLRDISIMRCFFMEKIAADVLYAHFWDCGIAASKLAERADIPVFVATGESCIRVKDYYPQKVIDRYLPFVRGVISVSIKNLEESRQLGLLQDTTKTVVLPNAVDFRDFFQMQREDARRKLGFNNTDIIVVFVGTFCHRKGVLRVVEAAERVSDVKLILIGSGEQKPESDRIIFSGRVAHDEIVTYLNAADLFVLPTLAEGCCNAIVEAMACGLPIISSDLPFNDDILDDSNSIRVDPNNIDEIADAIKLLKDDRQLRQKLSQNACRKAESLSIDKRAKAIYRFMTINT